MISLLGTDYFGCWSLYFWELQDIETMTGKEANDADVRNIKLRINPYNWHIVYTNNLERETPSVILISIKCSLHTHNVDQKICMQERHKFLLTDHADT